MISLNKVTGEQWNEFVFKSNVMWPDFPKLGHWRNAMRSNYEYLKEELGDIFDPLEENGVWRNRYNNELYSLFNEPDIIKHIVIRRLEWIGHVLRAIVLPAKEDLWQSLSYVANWNEGPESFDSNEGLRGERRACHNEVITRPAGLKVPVWQLWVVSIATDCKQWPWLGFCQNRTSLVALWLDTFILWPTASVFRSSLAHLFRDHLWVELL